MVPCDLFSFNGLTVNVLILAGTIKVSAKCIIIGSKACSGLSTTTSSPSTRLSTWTVPLVWWWTLFSWTTTECKNSNKLSNSRWTGQKSEANRQINSLFLLEILISWLTRRRSWITFKSIYYLFIYWKINIILYIFIL